VSVIQSSKLPYNAPHVVRLSLVINKQDYRAKTHKYELVSIDV